MPLIENILAASDFSGPSRRAAERAAKLAGAASARLRLVHALSGSALTQLQQMLGVGSATEQELVDEAQQALGLMASELGAMHGLAIECSLVKGAVVEEIADEAEKIKADIVVVGARGIGFMRHFLLGSTAEKLLRKSARPILVVKQPAREPYRRVLVPVDFSDCSAHLIELALRVAPGAHLVLLHAYEVPFEGKLRFARVSEATIEGYRLKASRIAALQLQALATGAGLGRGDWSSCIPHANPSLAVVEQEDVMGCDLIVIGKHGKHRTEDLLLGSVTKNVLVESIGDVLVSGLEAG